MINREFGQQVIHVFIVCGSPSNDDFSLSGIVVGFIGVKEEEWCDRVVLGTFVLSKYVIS